MHSYIIYNKLASLYVCFAMLHTTLHNETEIINSPQKLREHTDEPNLEPKFRNFNEENGFAIGGDEVPSRIEEEKQKVFDMIIPQHDEDILLWQKTGNYVTISYSLDSSLSVAQHLVITDVLQSIEAGTCIRFTVLSRPGDDSDFSDGNAKLYFRIGRERAAHLGRRPGGPQLVTLAPSDGRYWVLHMMGHVLGLPHPHDCLNGSSSSRDTRNITRSGCVRRYCPWRRFDPGSALQLTAEELGLWGSPHRTARLNSASSLLALWRARRTARPSHWDLLALNDLYRCREGRPRCPPPRCRHGGFVDVHCRCVCPPGFAGEDCGVKARGGGAGGENGCVRHVKLETELRLSPSGLPGMASVEAADQCVVRVRAASQRLRVLVTVNDANVSKITREQSVMLYAEALLCSVKMYVFQIGGYARTFCILDYLQEAFVLNIAGNFVDVLFHASPSQVSTRQAREGSRLVVRSADALSKNVSATVATTAVTSSQVSTSLPSNHTGRGQMRSLGSVPSVNLLILPPILFALMGFNFLVVFCIKKYWEYRYGTAGIYRGTEGTGWLDHDDEEEEPDDYQIKVEYSNSFDAIKPGWAGMTRETSLPQAEMTDLELFRSMYGVPARAHPDGSEQGPPRPSRVPAVPSEVSKTDSVGILPSERKSIMKTVDTNVVQSEMLSLAWTSKSETEKSKSSSLVNVDKKSVTSTDANFAKQVELKTSSLMKGKASDDFLKPVETSSKPRKRVSFSDYIGEPLHVHADLPSEQQDGKPQTSTSSKKTSHTKAAADVCISVPFSGDAQPAKTTGDDSDSDQDSEESSCCDTSSSSSYHEDDDDIKKPEPGLFDGLTRCFQKKTNNDSSKIQ